MLKFLKKILSKKRKIEEHGTVALMGEGSTIILNNLPPKLKDLECFSIPYLIGHIKFDHVICDLCASISLMSFLVYKKLYIGNLKPTTISLQLVDRLVKYLVDILEDIPIQAGKLFIPTNFSYFRDRGRYNYSYNFRKVIISDD